MDPSCLDRPRPAARVRATELPPLTPIMTKVARMRAVGRDPIVLAQAMVAADPPRAFLEGLSEALTRGARDLHAYTADAGLSDLRIALARHLARNFGIAADPDRELIITPGANHAAYIALAAVLEPDDEVVCVSPCYFNHTMSVQLLGGRVRRVAARFEDGFVPDVSAIISAINDRTRAVILINPNNPSGACYSSDWVGEFESALAGQPRAQSVWVIADQTYQEIFYEGGRPRSAAAGERLRGRVVTVGSFSKCMAIAGWRVGFLAGPPTLVREALKLQDSSVICAGRAAQWAVARTLERADDLEEYSKRLRSELQARRDALMAGLGDAKILRPQGSCFAMLGLEDGRDAARFADRLLDDHDIAVVPGVHFGPEWGSALRLSFGTESPARLERAGSRIRALIAAG